MTMQPEYRQTGVGVRPVAITIICVIGLIGVVLAVVGAIYLLSAGVNSLIVLPSWYWIFVAAATIFGLVSFIGLWQMKKWGLYLYTAVAVIGQLVLIVAGLWTFTSLVAPLIVIIVGFIYVSRMT